MISKSFDLEDAYRQATPRSAALAEAAQSIFADGVATDTRTIEPYGLYFERGEGARKWDVDGREYLDFFGGHGSLMLGHCHPRVTNAVSETMARGIQFAAGAPQELDWAKRILSNFPHSARLRFTASGTESTLLALRIARAATGRRKIVRIATHYHGWHDFAASGYVNQFDGSAAPGILNAISESTILIAPGDHTALAAAFAADNREIAAIIMEPVGTHFGIVPVADEFILAAYELAKANNSLVILDEVISGFRVGAGGMQALLGIQPDITCLAKAAAGGMPGGVVCGTTEVMSVLERKDSSGQPNLNKIAHMGTFSANPVTAAAAVATIDELTQGDHFTHASENGTYARQALNGLFERLGVNWLAYGRFSSFHILAEAPAAMRADEIDVGTYRNRPVKILQKLRLALNLVGADIGTRGTAFISAVHTRQDIDQLVESFSEAIKLLKRAGYISDSF